jgi:hypothetical protein
MGTSLRGGTNDNSFVRPDSLNRLANYAPIGFDRRPILAINYVYNMPKFFAGDAFTRLLTDGCQISGVAQAQTGSPFTPGATVSDRAIRSSRDPTPRVRVSL